MLLLIRVKNVILYFKCILIDELLIYVYKLLMYLGVLICNIIFELYGSVLNILYLCFFKIVCYL